MAAAMMNDFTDVSPDGQGLFMPKGMKWYCSKLSHLLDRRLQQVILRNRKRSGYECRAAAPQTRFSTKAERRLPTRKTATLKEIAILANRQRTKKRRKGVTSIKMLGPQTALPCPTRLGTTSRAGMGQAKAKFCPVPKTHV